MRALGRCLAALLVAMIATPGFFGFVPSCCKHPKSTPRVVVHQCDHDDAQKVVDASGSCSSTIRRCAMCTNMLPAREERRLPKTDSGQLSVKSVTLATISPRFSLLLFTEPPPQNSAVRRATLCSFLI